MHKLAWMCGIGLVGACAAAPGGSADPATAVATSDSLAYRPMGFARITDTGAVAIAFDSASTSPAPVTVSHSTGNYSVAFAGLAAASLTDATGGDVQLTAEGTSNVRCRVLSWGGSPDLTVSVQCNQPGGALADSGFTVLFYRDTMPVTVTVSGDLGPWDTSPFLRASLASKYGAAGYCKVESLTASGAAPSSTATTRLRCYDATGAVVPSPQLTFTHVTSDASGPC